MSNEVKYYEYADEYYVAEDKESCIQFISECEGEELKEIAKSIRQVSKDFELDSFVLESLEELGFSSAVYAEIHNVTLEEIYTLVYKSEKELPLQIVYQG